jgi:glycogen debranching enzyme
VQQGWKDSHDSVFHSDGALAEGPIALCEVQTYVYAAKRYAATMASALGKADMARSLNQQALALQEKFEQMFWREDLSTYALALDGKKRPCAVKTSNAGHALFTGIAEPSRAKRTAQTLMGSESFSGWGIRTVAGSEVRYNPMSYHNGSVWPHDNALIAYGMARYRMKSSVMRILEGLFDASLYVNLNRLPELFCGFIRREGEGPTLYPVACAPQSWAAGSVFLLLQACLGLTVDAVGSRLLFDAPVLPRFLRQVQIKNLRVGQAVVDLAFYRHEEDVGMNVLRRQGEVEIVMVK